MWSAQSGLQSEIFLSNSFDMVKNLYKVRHQSVTIQKLSGWFSWNGKDRERLGSMQLKAFQDCNIELKWSGYA